MTCKLNRDDAGLEPRYGTMILKFRWSSVVAFMIAVVLAAVPSYAASDDGVLASVNGRQLRQLHLDRVMREILPMASFHGGITEEVRATNEQKAIKQMVEDELLYDEAMRLGIKADESAIDKELKETINRVGGRAAFDKALKHHGVSEVEYRRLLALPGTVKKVLEVRVNEAATVSEAEVRAYYDKNKDSHFRMQRRRFRHIVFRTDPGVPDSWEQASKKAKDVLDKINEGEDFALMAQEFSEGPRKDKGGDTGYITKSHLPGELGNNGWGMKPGEVSDVLQTLYGYHILKMEGEPSNDIVPFDKARGQIEYQMKQTRRQQLKARLMDELREKAEIKVYIDD